MTTFPKPAYITSGPHLSGWRVTLGYSTMAEAQDAHTALAHQDTPVETKCRAGFSYGGSDPQDCNWPMCDCDHAAVKVLAALDDAGYAVVDVSTTPLARHGGAIPSGEAA